MHFVITYLVPVIVGFVLAFLLNRNSQTPADALVGLAIPVIGGVAYMRYILHYTDNPHLIWGLALGFLGWLILIVLYMTGIIRLESN